MFLRTLHIAGFKSFAQPVHIELGLGITGIVGPNGSGKSNIVDAVRWVLGEQSARAIRGTKSEDVIFSGSVQRHAQGMAEVSLVLDNADGRVALDVAEVAIARRLYRSGDGEYLLNRKRARLRDVLDVAGQAGLGPDSYCVVGQGAIEQLVLQRPQERRALIADAADVRRHEARLAEIESSLAETQQNALRISAVVTELRPQLDRLRQQAERAERHRRIREDVELLARTWFGRAIPAAQAALTGAERRRAELHAAIAEARNALAELERQRQVAQEVTRDLRGAVAQHERRLTEARTAREAQRVEAAGFGERRQAILARLGQLESQRDETAQAVTAAEEAARASATAYEAGRAETAADLTHDDNQEVAAAEAAVATARRQVAEAERHVEEARRQLEMLERMDVRLQAEQEAAVAATAGAATRRQELEARVAEFDATLAAQDHEVAAARERLRAADERVAVAKGDQFRQQGTRRAAEDAWSGARRTLDRLVGEERALASIDVDTRDPGMTHALIQFVSSPTTYQRAIAAALGTAARFVVVDVEETAWQVEGAGGRLEGILVPRRRSRTTDVEGFRRFVRASLGDEEGYVLAADVLPSDAWSELATRYLGLTVIVESLPRARAIAARLAAADADQVFQVATVDGQCLRSNGEHVLGPEPAVAQGIEVRARRAELTERVEAARAALELAEVALASARQVEGEAEAAVRSAEDERRSAASNLGSLQEQVRTLQGARQREQTELERLAGSVAREPKSGAAADLPGQLEAARAALVQAETAQQAQRAALDAAEEARRGSAERRAAHTAARAVVIERLERLRQTMERDQREVSALRQRSASVAAEHAKVEAELQQLVARNAALTARLAEAEAAATAAEQQAAESHARHTEHEQTTGALVIRLEGLQSELADEREAEAGVAAEVERSRGLLGRLQVEAESAAEHLALRTEDLWESGDSLPSELVRLDDEDLQRRVGRALRELRGVGNVDYGVLAEYRKLSDRYDYLTEQLDDLARAEATIREGMDEARQRIQAQFGDVFEEVNTRFKELFRELFRGGDAELLLAGDPGSPQSGVDIVAQPPGKRLHRLATLSGGERALVGAALLLALISANPSPFCMLDEVDAALDEANVQRFVATIREMAQRTQFILVTHNRATMEMSDALYGVTMNPGAISQVLAIRLPD